MACTVLGLGSCTERPRPLEIDNALTAEEIAAGRFTPEVMWKMGKARRVAAFARRQTARLHGHLLQSRREPRRDGALPARHGIGRGAPADRPTSNNTSPAWSADGRTLYFLSDRSGTQQVWRMAAAGGEPQQVTAFDADVEGFGVNKPGDAIWYVQTVAVPGAEKCSADLYKDMPRSKAHIYDDLMARHWNYWDEGRYRHLFIAALTDGKAAEGVDIVRRRRGVGRTHGALLRHGRDRMGNAGDRLAYTCKPSPAPTTPFRPIRTSSSTTARAAARSTSASRWRAASASTPWYTAIRPSPAMTNTPSGRPTTATSPSARWPRPATRPTRAPDALRLPRRRSPTSPPSFDYHATNVAWADDRTPVVHRPDGGNLPTLPPRAAGPPTPRAAPSTCRRSSRRVTTTSTPSRWPADASSPK